MKQAPAEMLAVALLVCMACGGPATAPPTNAPGNPAPGQPTTTGNQVTLTNPTKRVPDPGLPVVRELTSQFYRGDLVHLRDRFSTELKATISLDQLAALRTKVEKEYGKEVAVIGEDWQVKGKYRGFVRWARFDKHEGPIEVQWILHREDDEVAGFFIRPAKKNG